MENNYIETFDNLKDKIFLKLEDKTNQFDYMLLNYTNHILDEDYYLVDRKLERKLLLSKERKSFYLQGVPFSGKSQLMKVIVKESAKNYEILWFQLEDLEDFKLNELFLKTLTIFLLQKFDNTDLKNYFSEYGYYLNINLISLICDILKKYNILIVIDDTHKCKNSNIQLKKLFEFIIIKEICKIYFIGWFCIFDKKRILDKYMKNIILSGLDENDLNKIIKKNTGKLMNEVASKIYLTYNGLPGFANLINDEFIFDNLKDEETFFYSFYDLLQDNEVAILQSLAISRFKIPLKVFTKLNLIKEVRSLENKRIIENCGEELKLHDRYKIILKERIYNDLNLKAFQILTIAKDFNLKYLFDLINLNLQFKNYMETYRLLDKHFFYLINNQPASVILDILNDLLRNLNYKHINLFIKKIILLERLEQYELCMNHIELIKNQVERNSLFFEEILYNELRCLYFMNDYNRILDIFNNNYQYIRSFSIKNYIQIHLIIARIFFVKGDLKTALKLYLYNFRKACANFEIELSLKALHKIIQIEIEYKLYNDAFDSLERILEYDSIISIKRKSYIYHRMAVCQYNLNDLDLAERFSQKSLSLKESINLKRGFIFSYKINSLICMKKNDLIMATKYIKKAINYSLEENLFKEALNCGIVELEILNNGGQNELAKKNLLLLFKYAKDNKFLKSINKIVDIAPQIGVDRNLLNEIEKIHMKNPLVCEKQIFINIQNIINDNFNNKDNILYNKLYMRKESISQLLLNQLYF